MSACTGGVSTSHNDRKIGCETLADDDDPPPPPPPPANEPLLLSAEAELDWIDRNAFIERKESDEAAIPVNISPSPNPNPLPPSTHSGSNFGSQRHNNSNNVKSKPLIGFPTPQKSGSYREGKSRRPASIRLFPKRTQSSSSRKSGVSMAEPSSPKVSCIGRVRSKRDRSRRKKTGRQKQLPEQAITRSKSQKRGGFWSSFRCIFRSRNRKQPKAREQAPEPPAADPPPLGAVRRFSSARRSDAWAADLEADQPDRPINIGGVKRFSSGRRSDAFAAELDLGGDLPPSIGAVKRFTSGRRSDAWAADLETTPSADPPSLAAVKRFASGRRSDAWAGEVEDRDDKSEPLDHTSILERKIGLKSGPHN